MLTEKEVRRIYQGELAEVANRIIEDVQLWRLRRYMYKFERLYVMGEVLEISREGTDDALAERIGRHKEQMQHESSVPA